MITIASISKGVGRWIDAVAESFGDWIEKSSPTRSVTLRQIGSESFVLEANYENSDSKELNKIKLLRRGNDQDGISIGLLKKLRDNRVNIVLLPEQFLFRTVELPIRAGEFLDGIVRTQIDRLTPWNGPDAAFGWSKPVPLGDRITCTVAATARTVVLRYVDALRTLGVHSITIYAASLDDPTLPAFKVWEEIAPSALDVYQLRRALIAILASAGVAAILATGSAAFMSASFETQRQELARQIQRDAAGTARSDKLGSTKDAQRDLALKKFSAPLSVLILETLSEILPDHTYVTELRIEGSKLNLTGVTRDAPSLIGLIEKSGRFSRATFFAPTTRSQSESGERFHIEAFVLPPNDPRS